MAFSLVLGRCFSPERRGFSLLFVVEFDETLRACSGFLAALLTPPASGSTAVSHWLADAALAGFCGVSTAMVSMRVLALWSRSSWFVSSPSLVRLPRLVLPASSLPSRADAASRASRTWQNRGREKNVCH